MICCTVDRLSSLDVLDFEKTLALIKKYKVKQVYLLAALLSATAEQKIKSAWRPEYGKHPGIAGPG
jgi:hypothetical protein